MIVYCEFRNFRENFSPRITLIFFKDMFAMLKIWDWSMIYSFSKQQNDFVLLQGIYFHEALHKCVSADIEEQVIHVILELASPDSLDDYRTEAVAVSK